MSARLELTANGIPLVNDENERLMCCIGNTNQVSHQVVTIHDGYIRISHVDVGHQLLLNMFHDAVILEACGEIGQVEENDRIFVQVLLKRRVRSDFKVGKKRS